MRCLMCESLSLKHICNQCQETYLKPKLYTRTLDNGVKVYSFYRYEEIKSFLHTKHTDIGFHIFTILAQNSFQKFTQLFSLKEKAISLGIDDRADSGYSHTAILNRALSSSYIKPRYAKLRAKNRVSYSGKSRKFRENNPRNFQFINFKEQNIILVDDIITSGATLNQAITCLKDAKKEVLFCITLCDVSNKQ